MPIEKKEILIPTPCSWCTGGSILDVSPGVFRDSDVDFSSYSYPGIPVCGGCGGLGETLETEDFKERTSRIMKTRFEFHPTDGLPEPPSPVLLKALEGLDTEVKALVERYGHGADDSYAKKIAEGYLEKPIEMLKVEVSESIEAMKNFPVNPDPAAEETRSAILALYQGDFDKGKEMFKEVIKDHPTNSIVIHDFGTLMMNFFRNPEKAFSLFKRSTELEPKKALHFYQAGKCLLYLKRHEEAITWFERAMLQPDFLKFAEDRDEDLNELINNIISTLNKSESK